MFSPFLDPGLSSSVVPPRLEDAQSSHSPDGVRILHVLDGALSYCRLQFREQHALQDQTAAHEAPTVGRHASHKIAEQGREYWLGREYQGRMSLSC